MKSPEPFLKNAADITFQRVVFFPRTLARVWGFTACAGRLHGAAAQWECRLSPVADTSRFECLGECQPARQGSTPSLWGDFVAEIWKLFPRGVPDCFYDRDPRGVAEKAGEYLIRCIGYTCARFVAFRGRNKVTTFLDCVLANQRQVASDRIALNLALWEQGAKWSLANDASLTDEHLLDTFSRHASQSIIGHIQNLDIALEALPATTFWRHSFINLDRTSNVVLHPNSPKRAQAKLDIFRNLLGTQQG